MLRLIFMLHGPTFCHWIGRHQAGVRGASVMKSTDPRKGIPRRNTHRTIIGGSSAGRPVIRGIAVRCPASKSIRQMLIFCEYCMQGFKCKCDTYHV